MCHLGIRRVYDQMALFRTADTKSDRSIKGRYSENKIAPKNVRPKMARWNLPGPGKKLNGEESEFNEFKSNKVDIIP